MVPLTSILVQSRERMATTSPSTNVTKDQRILFHQNGRSNGRLNTLVQSSPSVRAPRSSSYLVTFFNWRYHGYFGWRAAGSDLEVPSQMVPEQEEQAT